MAPPRGGDSGESTMAGNARAKLEAEAGARSLGHHLSPFIQQGGCATAHCGNPACAATVVIQDGSAEVHALTHICPFLEQRETNGHG